MTAPAALPAIDLWTPFVPSREFMAHARDHFPLPPLGYLRVFRKGEPSPELFRSLCDTSVADDEQILAGLDAAGITRALITGFDEASTGGTTFVINESVAAC